MSKTDKDIEQELQTKIIQMRYLEEYLEDLANRESMAVTTLNDIQNAEETISELSKGKDLDTMVYIGGGMYTSSKINKIFISHHLVPRHVLLKRHQQTLAY